jgi:enoyl-CoA hydratase/carnithine racemase
MERLDKVFIAAIGGPALGGGCELALACDIRHMAKDAGAIGLPESTLGMMPGAGGTQRLSRALGPSRALEMILEGRPLDPAEALELGLVHRVGPARSLLEEATATALRLARRAPLSIAGAKRAVYEGGSQSLPDGLATERKWFVAAASSVAARRAMRAYVEALAESGSPPWASEDSLKPWRDGTAVDLLDEG